MEIFIKVYEKCNYCQGTGEIDDIMRGLEDCIACVNGKIEKLSKISDVILDWYMDKPTSDFIDYLKFRID